MDHLLLALRKRSKQITAADIAAPPRLSSQSVLVLALVSDYQLHGFRISSQPQRDYSSAALHGMMLRLNTPLPSPKWRAASVIDHDTGRMLH